MVDRVELHLLDQADEVRHLDRRDAVVGEEGRDPGDEVVQRRAPGRGRCSRRQIGPAALRDEPRPRAGSRRTRRASPRRAPSPRRRRWRRGRSRGYGTAALDEVLEQVAVVRGQLDDEALRPEARNSVDHLLGVAASVLDPGARVRREVRVVLEDVARRDVLLELSEQAVAADPDVERIERLCLVQLVCAEEALARRRASRDRRASRGARCRRAGTRERVS